MNQPGSPEPLPLAAGEHPPVPGAIKISSLDMAQRHHSAQTKARKAALDVLYQAELRGLDPQEVLSRAIESQPERDRQLTRQLVNGVTASRDQIDARVSESASPDWTLERMAAVDRNLARLGVYELDHTSNQTNVVIAEIVALADELSTDNSVRFLNGLLAQAARRRQTPEENR